MGGVCSKHGKLRYLYKILVAKHKGKSKRHSWECNIRMQLREKGWGIEDWIHLT